jgi:hypothetical protein
LRSLSFLRASVCSIGMSCCHIGRIPGITPNIPCVQFCKEKSDASGCAHRRNITLFHLVGHLYPATLKP